MLSYIFHPVFVPVYAIWFLVYVHPSYFSGFSEKQKIYTVFISALNLVGFPLLTIVLLKALGFIDSIYLRTKKDRIIPYIACSIFFFWAYLVFKKQELYPLVLPSFILGIFLAVNAALIVNIYLKISMHALGMGGWLGFFIVLAFSNTMLMTWPLSLVILLGGLVCTARLLVSDHEPGEVYAGFFTGMVCQFVAAYVVL